MSGIGHFISSIRVAGYVMAVAQTRIGRITQAVIIRLGLSLIVLAACALAATPQAYADGAAIKVISPLPGQSVQNQLSLRYSLLNANPNDYIPFWAVDNGQWNHMATDPNSHNVAVADISVGSWNWQKSGNYKLQFIELNLMNGSWIEQDVTIHIGAPAPAVTPLVTNTDILSDLGITTTANLPLFADPTSDVTRQALDRAASRSQHSNGMKYLAAQPMAAWFGDWNRDVRADVKAYVDRAAAVKQLPVLITYNIPGRDCGGYSAGGTSSDNYSNWIRSLSDGIAGRPALVVLEPDALAGMDCLNDAGQANRISLLQQALTTLKSQKDTRVYIDAGHPNWQSASTMASRLKSVNIDQADGFSLNISNFITTSDNISYGSKISDKVGGKHFVIDTSRNGNGPANNADWCNPSGRALGQAPTTVTNNKLVDAFLWVKGPGGSDGTCGVDRAGTAAPSAGSWWPEYADELLTNSGY